MIDSVDLESFLELVKGVHTYYAKDLTKALAKIWWNGLCDLEYQAISDALNRYMRNTDQGRFMPKIADVRLLITGNTKDVAMQAFSRLEQAAGRLGAYKSVVFDDPIIHRVVQDMGGWMDICATTEAEWPFRGKEFVDRYRSYLTTAALGPHPAVLLGYIDTTNAARGFPFMDPVLVGDPERAKQVHSMGSQEHITTLATLGRAMRDALPKPASSSSP